VWADRRKPAWAPLSMRSCYAILHKYVDISQISRIRRPGPILWNVLQVQNDHSLSDEQN